MTIVSTQTKPPHTHTHITQLMKKEEKKTVMLLTPISNYSIDAHMSTHTQAFHLLNLNILIRRNKFIFFCISNVMIVDRMGKMWKISSLPSIFPPSVSLSLGSLLVLSCVLWTFMPQSAAAVTLNVLCLHQLVFVALLNLHWLMPPTITINTTELDYSNIEALGAALLWVTTF